MPRKFQDSCHNAVICNANHRQYLQVLSFVTSGIYSTPPSCFQSLPSPVILRTHIFAREFRQTDFRVTRSYRNMKTLRRILETTNRLFKHYTEYNKTCVSDDAKSTDRHIIGLPKACAIMYRASAYVFEYQNFTLYWHTQDNHKLGTAYNERANWNITHIYIKLNAAPNGW